MVQDVSRHLRGANSDKVRKEHSGGLETRVVARTLRSRVPRSEREQTVSFPPDCKPPRLDYVGRHDPVSDGAPAMVAKAVIAEDGVAPRVV
jgi:hypothetical protein